MPATAYVTPQALVDEFGEDELVELTDRATPRTLQVDVAVSQQACDRANAEIDSFLRARYPLPLATTPDVLKYVGRDLARYYLHEREPGELVKDRYNAAIKKLRDIATGVQALDVGNVAPSDLPQFSSGEKVFSRGMV